MVPPSPVDSPPPSVDMEVGFGALSRQGPGRSVNDDHYLIMRMGRHLETLKTSLPDGDLPRHFDEYGYGMVIADGMGSAGDLASRLAIATLVQLAIDFSKWHVRVNEPIADEMMDRAERYYAWWYDGPTPVHRQLARGLKQLMSLSCYEQPEMMERVGYRPGPWIAEVTHRRLTVFKDDVQRQAEQILAPDPLRPGVRVNERRR